MTEVNVKKKRFGRTTVLTLNVLYTLSISTLLFSIFCYFQLEIRQIIFKSLFTFSILNSINIAFFYLHKKILKTYVVASFLGFITLVLISTYSDGVNSPAISFLVLLIFFGYLIGERYGNFWLLTVLITVLVFYLLTLTSIEFKNEIKPGNTIEFNLLFLLFLILLLGGVFGRMMNKTNSKIKQAKLEIVKRNDEKSIMLKEIHHRVKNNLQVVNSLLRMQSRSMSDDHVKQAFQAAQNRVVAMARLHENIYHTQDLKNIDIAMYIKTLITDLIRNINVDKDISLKLNISKINMSIDTLLPISLIINELVSNSLKHAFKTVHKGEIVIELNEIDDEQCKLTVYDDGCASQADVLNTKTNSIGITLIKTLTRQLHGDIKMLSIPQGTGFEISFLNSNS